MDEWFRAPANPPREGGGRGGAGSDPAKVGVSNKFVFCLFFSHCANEKNKQKIGTFCTRC